MQPYEMSAFVDGDHRTLDLPPVAVVLDWLISGKVKYAAVDGVGIAPKAELDDEGHQTFPRLLVTHHAGHGLVVLLMRSDGPDLFVSAAARCGLPEVYVFIPPNVHELWPRELFVSSAVAAEAIAYALEHGQPKPDLHWVRNGDFSRGAAERR